MNSTSLSSSESRSSVCSASELCRKSLRRMDCYLPAKFLPRTLSRPFIPSIIYSTPLNTVRFRRTRSRRGQINGYRLNSVTGATESADRQWRSARGLASRCPMQATVAYYLTNVEHAKEIHIYSTLDDSSVVVCLLWCLFRKMLLRGYCSENLGLFRPHVHIPHHTLPVLEESKAISHSLARPS